MSSYTILLLYTSVILVASCWGPYLRLVEIIRKPVYLLFPLFSETSSHSIGASQNVKLATVSRSTSLIYTFAWFPLDTSSLLLNALSVYVTASGSGLTIYVVLMQLKIYSEGII